MKKNTVDTSRPAASRPAPSKPGASGAGTSKPDITSPDASTSRQSKAQRDAHMNSPSAIRNTTAPRKVRDMPEDEGHKDRDPEKDYDGEAGKDH